MTAPLERVFRVFLDDPAALRYGYDLMNATVVKFHFNLLRSWTCHNF
jgi:hypothetical protein